MDLALLAALRVHSGVIWGPIYLSLQMRFDRKTQIAKYHFGFYTPRHVRTYPAAPRCCSQLGKPIPRVSRAMLVAAWTDENEDFLITVFVLHFFQMKMINDLFYHLFLRLISIL